MEETLRTLLSHLLSHPTPSSLTQSLLLLTSLLKLHTLLALTIQILIPPLIPPVLFPILTHLIGADKFPSQALHAILYAYIYYIPIMAVNGVTESFISSVASPADISRQSRAMVLFSGVFLAVAWGLLRLAGMGGEALVWANCVNLGVRIVWSVRFITAWYKVRGGRDVGWDRVVPRVGTMLLAGMLALGIRGVGMRGGLDGFGRAVGVVGSAGVVFVVGMYIPLVFSCVLIYGRAYFEREFLGIAYGMVYPKGDKKTS